ncbi:hypothetical protein MLD38_014943 [Melastoma candidum]|uniref:Uncharacterized protein n=1 Tax=Melastoma candidum TaxID=119954 RepID=A0ACB9RF06_9MYRT|nr:hypothetical protein MLD38_014943 [Melastoma candidum]
MAGADQAARLGQEVLHQRRSMPKSPLRMAVGGVAMAAVIGFFTLLTKKKPEASVIDVAKVAAGVAHPDNTHPPK